MPKSRRGNENRFCRATVGYFLNNASFMSEGLGDRLRTDTPEHHVEDMLAAGIIRKI
ncbi:MAG: hypothetical protein J6I40_07670 [Mailhella sp.]|nr:hypothetical protein [Mailhella sp.]